MHHLSHFYMSPPPVSYNFSHICMYPPPASHHFSHICMSPPPMSHHISCIYMSPPPASHNFSCIYMSPPPILCNIQIFNNFSILCYVNVFRLYQLRCYFYITGKYESHTRVHTREKPFQCDVCLQCYSTKSNLTVHKKKHTADAPVQRKDHKCPFCNKLHASRKTLGKHVKR